MLLSICKIILYNARAPSVTYMTLTFEDAPLCLVQSFFQEMKLKTNCL